MFDHESKTPNPVTNTVTSIPVAIARSIDDAEKDNVKYSNVTVFTTKDIKERGVEAVMEEAFKIASYKTKGVHVSYDLDVIDTDVAPGVSIPEFDGITEDEAMQITESIVAHMKDIVSFDLVEFNPLRDQERKTEQIAINILSEILAAAEEKKKWESKQLYY